MVVDIYQRPSGPTVARDDDGKFLGVLIAPLDIVGISVCHDYGGSYVAELDTLMGTLRWSTCDLEQFRELRNAVLGPPPTPPVAKWESPPRPPIGTRRR